MKLKLRRWAALTLAAVLGLSPMAAASEAMGTELQGGSVDLSVGTSLTRQIFWSDTYADLRAERYFTYRPNADVTPVVAYGDKVTSRATLTDMAKGLEAEGKRLIGGVNGDLYVMATGTPLGMVVTDGVLRSSDAGHYAVGFRADGTAFIGKPLLGVTASFRGMTFAVTGGVNKVRLSDGYFIYTPDFGATTMNTEPGIDVVLTPVLENLGQTVDVDLTVSNGYAPQPAQTGDGGGEEATSSEDLSAGDAAPVETQAPAARVKASLTQSAQLAVGARVTCTVDQVLQSTGPVSIPEGKIVLSINNKGNSFWTSELGALQPGDTVQLDVTTPEQPWTEAKEAMGGLYKLVTGGAVEGNLPAERTAYSAVGVKADGTAVFYTIDGKQPGYSVGATLKQVAMRMAELGCVDAISLDGGGSTTIGATAPDGSGLEVLNKPSDGSQRANSVALFLATELEPTGDLGSYYVTPSDGILLAGAAVQLTATAVDTAYYAMSGGPAPDWSADGGGTVDGNGLFTAGSADGAAKVTAAAGSASGSAALTVVKTPESITLMNETPGQENGVALTALNLEPGETVDLKANAFYKKLLLTSQDACFTWTMDGQAATVDQSGVVTAGDKTAAGSLTVAAGGTTLTIPVTVAGHVEGLDGFETWNGQYEGGMGVTAAQEADSDHVRYGRHSLRMDYDASAAGTASMPAPLNFQPGERYLNLWVYGDGSGNTLTATVAAADGATRETVLTALDFTGWRYVSAPLGEGAAALRSVNLIYAGGERSAGTIWLDAVSTSNEAIQDVTPPAVTLSLTGNTVTAVVMDDVDRDFEKSQLTLTWDGKARDFTWDAASHTLTATAPGADKSLHRITVTAADASGNIGRGSVNQNALAPGEGEAPRQVFTDTAGHWAADYAVYLYDRGVTTGVPNEADGTLQFQPDRTITRGEFFAMAGRWLGLDLNAYAGTELPFTDAAAIPDWALPGVKAMYALGYLKGTSNGDGTVRADAGATISRAEAMTLLGRIQERGYAEAELTFDDAAAVPDWAAPYVRTLVGQGVVGGFENRIMPGESVKRGEVAKMLFLMT